MSEFSPENNQQPERETILAFDRAHFDAFFAGANTGLVIFDRQLRYVRINEALAELNGVAVADHIGKPLRQVLPELALTLEPLLQGILDTGVAVLDYELVGETPKQPGVIRYWLASYYPLVDKNSTIFGVGGVVIEITGRKKVEEALKQSEERFRSLMEASAQIIWIANDQGELVIEQPTWSAFTGQEFEQYKGWGWLSTVHPEDSAHVASAWSAAVANRSLYEVEFRMRRHDGEYRYMTCRALPILEADGTIREWIGANTDITERKQAEQALREQQAALRDRNMLLYSILESTPDFIVVKDREGRHVALNSNLANFLGKPMEEILGEDDFALLPPDVAREMVEKDRQIMATGLTEVYEEEVTNGEKSGTFLTTKAPWRDAQGNIIGIVGTTRDISDRKQAEIALQYNEERFRSLTEATSQLIWTTNSNGELVTGQTHWNAFTGQSFEELQGLGWLSAIHPEDQSHAVNVWLEAEANKTICQAEYRLRHQSGEYRYMSMRAVPLSNPDGSIREWFGVHTDISDRKQAEIALAQAKEAAEAASRSKSEFLANMSHELRTPLNGIMGYAQILQRSKLLDGEDRPRIDVIYQCASHLLTLINDILDLSKIEAQKVELMPTDFHFPAFLQGVAEMCRIRAELKAIQFHYQLAPEVPIGIRADEKRLRQVLINLLSNAIKFTDKGSVTFTVSYATEGKIRFEVRDTGIGLAPEQIQPIFQPFEQVGDSRRQTEGTGLGLAISQKIVHLMESTIQVQSELGVGSIFWFDVELPQADEWVKTSQTDQHGQIIGIKDRRPKVIVIDDKWANRSVVTNLLTPIGFEMFEAVDGQDGWQKIQEIQPDLVITDLLMPHLDGFGLIERLRKSEVFKNIVIIVSSASVFETDQHKSIEAGGNAFLPKPIQAMELLEKLQKHLQLEWIYEAREPLHQKASTTDEIMAPPASEMETLYELAMKGNFRDLIKQAGLIEKLDPKYIPFAQKLHQLAKDFQDEEILAFIQSYQ